MRGSQGRGYSSWSLTIVIFSLVACGSVNPATSSAGQSALPKTGAAAVNIPAGDRFLPFVTQVSRGGTLTFNNGDTDAHTVTSVPGDPSTFDVRIEPGATVTLTLKVAGAYRYYCSIHARYDSQTDQIAGKDNADHPNEPMAGVVLVV